VVWLSKYPIEIFGTTPYQLDQGYQQEIHQGVDTRQPENQSLSETWFGLQFLNLYFPTNRA
jgi:hypothetical protein